MTDLLERSSELAALDRLLAESAAGGRVAVVSGEAGAGKSTLAAAFAEAAGPRAQTLWGACDPLLTPRALGPLHDIARRLGGTLRERIAAGARAEVFDLLLEALDRPPQAARPVVVLEDLHWADEATLDMVVFLGRRLALCRALLLITYREEEIGTDHRLRAVLAGLPPGLVRRVTLPPLTPAAVGELARRAGRPASEVYDVTGGNPLLVTEVLAAPARDVPATVRDLVLSRVAALSPEAREVAHLVSVVPSQSGVVVDRLDAVEECLDRGVLTARGNGVAFRHELLRRAVEESLSPVRRSALHAEILAGHAGRAGVEPARMVHHAHHAGDTAAVLHWAPIAARRAASLGAYRQAAAHYLQALPLLPSPAPTLGPETARERAALLEDYSVAAYHGGLTPEALEARREALALRTALGDEVRVGENLRWISRLSWWLGRPGEARDAGFRAVEVLEAQAAGRELAAAYSNLSQLFMLRHEVERAIGWGVRATELARRLGDLDTEVHALVNIGSAKTLAGDVEGIGELRRAHELALAAGLDDHAGRALVNLASFAVDGYELTVAGETLERIIPFLVARDLDGYVRHLLGHRARLHLARGDWDAASRDAEQALDGPPQPGGAVVPAMVVQAVLKARRGSPDALEAAQAAADHGYPTGEAQFLCPAAIALAEAHWLAGDVERAAIEAKKGLAVAERFGQKWFVGELAFWLWRCGGERTPGAATPFRLLIDGDWRGAAAFWQERDCPYARAEALAHGDEAAVTEAVRIFDRLGATARSRVLRADLRERGRPVPRGPRRPSGTGLTARQHEVLVLLAEGLSNADIAARLTVSAKTVDHHVSAILAKLGVSSRGRAAVVARELNIGNSPHVPDQRKP
ncbi:ATP-binding protein [Actinoplanes sp. NPDC048988]|uniref:ATP-binding protein n=1 Tax=Actinoplanes sp. NPDC048988 TaxID=3363901 RepID=UPI003711B7A7